MRPSSAAKDRISISRNALEQTPEVLDPLGVNAAVDVLIDVIYRFVREVLECAKVLIGDRAVRIDANVVGKPLTYAEVTGKQ